MSTQTRDFPELIRETQELAQSVSGDVKLMEVCGTHTMSAFKSGLRSLLPANISLLSGPGCPVCVTPDSYVDLAVGISRLDGVIVVTYGDMMKVPGNSSSLEREKAGGADIRVVYSPVESLRISEANRDKRVVFLGVGFETTAPLSGMIIKKAVERSIDNLFLLSAHKLIPPAMKLLLSSSDHDIQGFMCPGHVSVITGPEVYEPLTSEFNVPCVITGFEAWDMASGINMLLYQIREGRHEVENQYERSVRPGGNPKARGVMEDVFEVCDSEWRGIGIVPDSGLSLRERFRRFDAYSEFSSIEVEDSVKHSGCICGEVLKGLKRPFECGLFAEECTPDNPYGPCMVSSEGSCAAYYRFGRDGRGHDGE
ncbi:MAG: hydrogenase formation protein HypD [Chitinivibrionales bacterium]